MDYDTREFQARVEEAASYSGEGTELVTVWIPPDKNLDTIRSRVFQEHAEAENIKSKQTRDHVSGALERVQNILHKVDAVPENGLVVCSGYIDDVDDYVVIVYDDLPEPIRDSKYECSDEFAVDTLLNMAYGGSDWWGLVTVTRDTASIGRYKNAGDGYVSVIDTFESHVMGKTQAGGQSQARFARLREEQRQEHYKKVLHTVEANFDPGDGDFRGFAVGGPNVTVSDWLEHLPERLREMVVTVETVDHAGSEESLSTLAKLAEEAFSAEERRRERELVERFKRGLTGDSPVAYGDDEIETAIDYGAVDTLLVSADTSADEIDRLQQRIENQGGSVELISTIHEAGTQLHDVFDGAAALLRFDIN